MHTFSAKKWRDDPLLRKDMTDDLVRRYKLIGMKREEVIGLLGESEITGAGNASFKLCHEGYSKEATFFYFVGVDFVDFLYLILPVEDGMITDVKFDVR